MYLANGFDLEGAEGGAMRMTLTGMSRPIDEYYQAVQLGIAANKPRRRLTQWWTDICLAFEKRAFHRWSEAATMLLDVNQQNQQKNL